MRTASHTTNEFTAVDPRNGKRVGSFTEAGVSEVATAAAQASAAFRDPALADPERRIRLLEGTAAALRRERAAIVAVAESETGLPTARLEGELERTARQLEAFAALVSNGGYVDAYIDPPDPDAKPIPRPDVRRMLVPIGPVAVFGASNFPLAFSVAGGDTASALAAGCPVLVKGHPAHPGTGEAVAALIAESVASAGLPEGTFTFLAAAGAEVGEELVDREEIAAVSFTGSFNAGMALFRRAAARPHPIPVYAEMGSVNPLVISPGVLQGRADEIAGGLATAIGGSAGQLCTKPGIVFVPAGEAGEQLGERIARLLADQGPQVLLGENILDALVARAMELDQLAELIGGPSDLADAGPGFRVTGRIYRTDAASLVATPALAEENFGPVAVLAFYNDEADLLAALDSLEGQLTGTLHAEDGEVADLTDVVAALERVAGRVIFNGYPTGVAVTAAMQHGGPFPATSDPRSTSVGMTAIARFLRPIAWQDAPAPLLPPELQDANPRGIPRHVDGKLTTAAIT